MINLTLGVMNSGKTADLIDLARFCEYIDHGSHEVNVYSNSSKVMSRNGETCTSIDYTNVNKFKGDIVIIDECQFLTDEQIDYMIDDYEIEYYLFGLINDFEGNMFKATARLIQYADGIDIRTHFCELCDDRPATHHLLMTNEETLDKTKYKSVCYECWKKNK